MSVLGLGVLAGGLLLAGARQGMWFDETYTAGVVGQEGSAFWTEIAANDKGFAPYYILAKIWSMVFGYSDLGFRSLSITAHVAAVGLFWVFLRRRLGVAAAVVGTTVLAAGLLLLQQAVTARPYALVTLGCVGLLWLGAVAVGETREGAPSRGAWAGLVGLAALLPWLTPLAGMGAAIAIVVPVAWALRRDRDAVLLGLAVAITSWVGNVWAVRTTPVDPHPVPLISPGWLVDAGSLTLGGGWLAPIAVVLVAAALVAFWAGRSKRDADGCRWFGMLVLSLAVVPALLTVGLGLVGQQVYPRYAIGSAVGVAGCCAWAVTQIRWARWLIAPLVVLAAAQFLLVFWPLPTGHRDDWGEASLTIDTAVTAEDGLFTPSPQLRIPLAWYGRELPPAAFGRAVWPALPLHGSPPSRDYTIPPFAPSDPLPTQLPGTIWLLVLPTEWTAADSARTALAERGFYRTSSQRLWTEPSAPVLVLERYQSTGDP